jgi:DNA-binding CsgD family transcriptional regulator
MIRLPAEVDELLDGATVGSLATVAGAAGDEVAAERSGELVAVGPGRAQTGDGSSDRAGVPAMDSRAAGGSATGVAAGSGPRSTMDGRPPAPVPSSSAIVRGVVGTGATAKADTFGLSRREREVLAVIAEGRTNREIGERLFISQKTVGVHVGNILAKLSVSGRVEAAAVAIRLGLTENATAGSSGGR